MIDNFLTGFGLGLELFLMGVIFFISLYPFYYAETFFLKQYKKAINWYWVIPASIFWTYFHYGLLYLESWIESTIKGNDFIFTGCSDFAEYFRRGIDANDLQDLGGKCFFFFPSNNAQIGVMFGKLISSMIIFLLLYFCLKIYKRSK